MDKKIIISILICISLLLVGCYHETNAKMADITDKGLKPAFGNLVESLRGLFRLNPELNDTKQRETQEIEKKSSDIKAQNRDLQEEPLKENITTNKTTDAKNVKDNETVISKTYNDENKTLPNKTLPNEIITPKKIEAGKRTEVGERIEFGRSPYSFKNDITKNTMNGISVGILDYTFEKKGDNWGMLKTMKVVIDNEQGGDFFPVVKIRELAVADRSKKVEVGEWLVNGKYIVANLEYDLQFDKISEKKVLMISIGEGSYYFKNIVNFEYPVTFCKVDDFNMTQCR